MSTFDPNAVARRLRILRRNRLITHAEYTIGVTLLWSCRAPGRDDLQVSYDRLAQLAGAARSTAAKAVAALRALGVLTIERTRIRVAWAGGVASRQGRNIYRLLAGSCTESETRSTNQVHLRKTASEQRTHALSAPLSAALRALGERLAR